MKNISIPQKEAGLQGLKDISRFKGTQADVKVHIRPGPDQRDCVINKYG